jgi:hypothetical protein
MRGLWVGLALLGVATACGGGSSGPKAPSTFTVTGSLGVEPLFTLHAVQGGHCVSGDRFSDVAEGDQIKVVDGSGNTLAIGSLDAGTLDSTLITGHCTYDFAIPSVPPGKAFYQLVVGQHHSDEYTPAQIRQPINLTL